MYLNLFSFTHVEFERQQEIYENYSDYMERVHDRAHHKMLLKFNETEQYHDHEMEIVKKKLDLKSFLKVRIHFLIFDSLTNPICQMKLKLKLSQSEKQRQI